MRLPNLEVMKHPARRSKGFTLIEALVIIATLGLLAAVAVSVYQRVSGESAPHNAAKDIVEAMERARALAVEHKNDVFLIVYPGFNKRANTINAGRGAYYVYEDTGRDFLSPTGTAPNIYYRSGVGKEFDPVSEALSGPNGKVVESVFMDDYGGRIRFRLPRSRLELGPEEAPFAGFVITAACTFCTPGGRGAIVFSPDKSMRFLDGSGEPVVPAVGVPPRHAFTLLSDRSKHVSVVAISTEKTIAFKK